MKWRLDGKWRAAFLAPVRRFCFLVSEPAEIFRAGHRDVVNERGSRTLA